MHRIFYDDQCGLCSRWAAAITPGLFVRGFTVAGRDSKEFARSTSGWTIPSEPQIILCTETGRLLIGLDVYLFMADSFGWLRPLAWLMRRKPIYSMANAAYHILAANRYRISTILGLEKACDRTASHRK